MDERTLTALKASIKHWDENAAVEDVANAKVLADDCALCSIQPNHDGMIYCGECPVMRRTGYTACKCTPYYDARAYFYKAYTNEFKSSARDEAAFLRSLLPEGETA